MIAWMCRIFHEEPYQAKMDLTALIFVGVILYLGRHIIIAHIRTFHSEDNDEHNS